MKFGPGLGCVRSLSSPLLQAVLVDVLELLDRDWNITVIHGFREVNSYADYMAKIGVHSEGALTVWKDPLVGLGSVLLKDSLGLSPLP